MRSPDLYEDFGGKGGAPKSVATPDYRAAGLEISERVRPGIAVHVARALLPKASTPPFGAGPTNLQTASVSRWWPKSYCKNESWGARRRALTNGPMAARVCLD